MRVLVIGAGIGGLALAQALHRAGDDVRVVDRDAAVESTGGYRLHLDHLACAALRRALQPAHYQALLASSAGPGAFRQFAITDHRLRLLGVDRQDPTAERLLIGRVPLRRLLTAGLHDRVHFGQEYLSHDVSSNGTVTARLRDRVTGAVNTTDAVDLLVGADGVGSRVAHALAGRATSAPVGISGIAGRTPIDEHTHALVPDLLRVGPALAFGPGGSAVFLSLHDPTATAVDPTTCTQVAPDIEAPSLVWGLLAPDDHLPADLRPLSGTDLVATADETLAGWAPRVLALIAASDHAVVASYRFHATDPSADLTPWAAGSVTCLGDAVHAMPPTAGRAAATAIRDADLLAEHLAQVRAGSTTLAVALHDYHRALTAYAADAIRESLAPLPWVRASSGPLATRLTRAVLPVLALAASGYRRTRQRGCGPGRSWRAVE